MTRAGRANERRNKVLRLANYFEHLSGVLQIFGAAGIALLIVPVLITLLARDVPRVLLTLANEGARQSRGLVGR